MMAAADEATTEAEAMVKAVMVVAMTVAYGGGSDGGRWQR